MEASDARRKPIQRDRTKRRSDLPDMKTTERNGKRTLRGADTDTDSPGDTRELRDYANKRTFASTPEPPPQRAIGRQGPLLFVVQQHSARRLHYDFRLEL